MGSQPAPRIPLPGPDEMSPAQREIYDEVIAGPRGRMVGPLRAVIHSPALALRWSRLGEFLRYETGIPARQGELAILVTGRRWTSQVEWAVHARAARDAGLPKQIIDAISRLEPPRFDDRRDALVYEFARQLQQTGHVDMKTYRAVHSLWGDAGVVELAALVGYYTMVAMTLNVHEIPLPDGQLPELDAPAAGGLAVLPEAAAREDLS